MGQVAEGQDVVIVNHCPMRVKRGLDALVPLVAFNGFGDGSDRHLRRQAELGTQGSIAEWLNRNRVGKTLLESSLGHRVTATVERLHRQAQGIGLFGRRLKFNDYRLLHEVIAPRVIRFCQYGAIISRLWKGAAAVLPPIKDVGFLPRLL